MADTGGVARDTNANKHLGKRKYTKQTGKVHQNCDG